MVKFNGADIRHTMKPKRLPSSIGLRDALKEWLKIGTRPEDGPANDRVSTNFCGLNHSPWQL